MNMRWIHAAAFALLLASAAFAAQPSVPEKFTDDATPDFEPTVFRLRDLSDTWGTVTVSIRHFGSLDVRNYVVSKVGTTFTRGYLPTPIDKPHSYDPYLYASQYGTGTAAYRLYCVGIVGDLTKGVEHNSITVWRSDNHGRDQFRTLPYQIVDSGTGAGTISNPDGTYEKRVVDKPTIAVNGYLPSRGYVYVAYMRNTTVYNSATNAKIKEYQSVYAARSTDGGNTWQTPQLVYSNENGTGKINSAHIVAANGTGYLYIAWVRYQGWSGGIMLARSPSSGTVTGSWVLDTTGPTGYMQTGGESTKSNDMVRQTLVIMRHNAVANKLIMVWNEPDGSSPSATHDVYYAEKGTGGWSVWNGVKKLKVSSDRPPCGTTETATDQVRPTLDYDGSGKITIAYYDRQQDCANDLYNVWFAQLTTGSTTPAVVAQVPIPFADLNGSSSSDLDANGERIGDYFDLWCDTATCYTAWIGTPRNASGTPQGDLLVTTIQ